MANDDGMVICDHVYDECPTSCPHAVMHKPITGEYGPIGALAKCNDVSLACFFSDDNMPCICK